MPSFSADSAKKIDLDWILVRVGRTLSVLCGPLSILAVGSFAGAICVYTLFARTDDILYILPLFLLPLIHLALGKIRPTSVGRFSEISSSLSLLVIGCCWLCLALCRAATKANGDFLIEVVSLQELAELFSWGSLVISGVLMASVWFTIVQLVRRPTKEPKDESTNGFHHWYDELKGYPTYALTLLFATLWQIICLLGFSLALHDMPAGRGLRSAGEQIHLGSLVFQSKTLDLSVEHTQKTEDRLRQVVRDWSTRGVGSRSTLLLTLPPGSHLRSEHTWKQVEEALSFVDGAVGNYAIEIKILHNARRLPAPPDAEAKLLPGTFQLSASEIHEPQLLDYLYFMTSTLVTTGYCDLVPISNQAKLLCTVANIYEVFFTVVFFSIVVSVLLNRHPKDESS